MPPSIHCLVQCTAPGARRLLPRQPAIDELFHLIVLGQQVGFLKMGKWCCDTRRTEYPGMQRRLAIDFDTVCDHYVHPACRNLVKNSEIIREYRNHRIFKGGFGNRLAA